MKWHGTVVHANNKHSSSAVAGFLRKVIVREAARHGPTYTRLPPSAEGFGQKKVMTRRCLSHAPVVHGRVTLHGRIYVDTDVPEGVRITIGRRVVLFPYFRPIFVSFSSCLPCLFRPFLPVFSVLFYVSFSSFFWCLSFFFYVPVFVIFSCLAVMLPPLPLCVCRLFSFYLPRAPSLSPSLRLRCFPPGRPAPPPGRGSTRRSLPAPCTRC